MWPPLNASGEGSPHTANGVSNSMQQFQGTCTCTHMYQWNHTCPTNGTSGTFSPHNKWTYYLAVPTTPPPTTCPSLKEGANGTIPTQYNYQPSSLQANGTINSQLKLQLNLITSHCKSSQKRSTTSGATSPSTYGVIRPFTASRRVNGAPITMLIDPGSRYIGQG